MAAYDAWGGSWASSWALHWTGEHTSAPPQPAAPTPTGGGRFRYFTPVTEEPRRKKRKRQEPEVVVKDDVVIETIHVDWAGIVGSVEEVRAEMLDEQKRLEARRKRARNKALILLMLS